MPSPTALAELREERRRRKAADHRTYVVLLEVLVAIAIGVAITSSHTQPFLDGLGMPEFCGGLFVILVGSALAFTLLLRRDASTLEAALLIAGSIVIALAVAAPITVLLALGNLSDT